MKIYEFNYKSYGESSETYFIYRRFTSEEKANKTRINLIRTLADAFGMDMDSVRIKFSQVYDVDAEE